MTGDERNKVPLFTDVWIDIGVKDRKEAEELVQAGDAATFALGYHPMRNELAASPGMADANTCEISPSRAADSCLAWRSCKA